MQSLNAKIINATAQKNDYCVCLKVHQKNGNSVITYSSQCRWKVGSSVIVPSKLWIYHFELMIKKKGSGSPKIQNVTFI